MFTLNEVGACFADIRRSTRPFLEDKTEDDLFQMDVRVLQLYIYFYFKLGLS